jgi:alkylation response protein AidB-like acyl-CoA dehydrogenase
MEDDERGYSRDLWGAMGDLGWQGLAVPERCGGAGLGYLELALLVEEMGRVLLPGPFMVNALCGALLSMAEVAEAHAERLAAIASGADIHSYAYLERSAGWSTDEVSLEVTEHAGGPALSGTKIFVAYANVASELQVWGRLTTDELAVFLVPAGKPGVRLTRLDTLARDSQFEVRLDGVRVAPEDTIRVDDRVAQRWTGLAAVLECAYLLGLAERDLEMTVEYAKDRQQFGQPIGAFQAVQHRAANMRIDVDAMRVATYRAAWALTEDDASQDVAVSVAKAFCSDGSRRVVGHGQQVHGGIGFTREHPLQLYFRRQKRGELAWGDGDFHRARLAALLDGGPA